MAIMYILVCILLLTIESASAHQHHFRHNTMSNSKRLHDPLDEIDGTKSNRQTRILTEYLKQLNELYKEGTSNSYYDADVDYTEPPFGYLYEHPLLLLMEIEAQLSRLNRQRTLRERLKIFTPSMNRLSYEDKTDQAVLHNTWPTQLKPLQHTYQSHTTEDLSKSHHRGRRNANMSFNTNCHTTNLKICGKPVIDAFTSNLNFSSRCKIRKDFLDCMVKMREKGCHEILSQDLAMVEDTKTIRDQIRKLLWSANGCLLGYDA